MIRNHLRSRRKAAVTLFSIMLLAACNAPMPTVDVGGTASLEPTRIPTNTTVPRSTATPAPTEVPSDLVWFSPNMGSVDFPALFAEPARWADARGRIDVFKFYIQNVLDVDCDICGGNTLSAFEEVGAFRKLEAWGIGIAVESGVVKHWGCEGDQAFSNVDLAIQNIERNGGKLSMLAMDEPLIGGEQVVDGSSCGNSVEESAAATRNFYAQMQAAHPAVAIGDIEPYPHYSVEELEAWIEALAAAGVMPAFFHLDVDTYRTRVESQDVAGDLAKLRQFTAERGIAFGVIFTSSWRQAYNNQVYYDSTMGWVEDVKEAIGRPQHVIFQSWQGPAPSGAHEIPSNLPPASVEDYSHTRLLLDGLDVLTP
ncbi:MAG: hypothetical protein WBR18_01760 [Anaerolineales bacterium]